MGRIVAASTSLRTVALRDNLIGPLGAEALANSLKVINHFYSMYNPFSDDYCSNGHTRTALIVAITMTTVSMRIYAYPDTWNISDDFHQRLKAP